jgi:hypothetical protein
LSFSGGATSGGKIAPAKIRANALFTSCRRISAGWGLLGCVAVVGVGGKVGLSIGVGSVSELVLARLRDLKRKGKESPEDSVGEDGIDGIVGLWG